MNITVGYKITTQKKIIFHPHILNIFFLLGII